VSATGAARAFLIVGTSFALGLLSGAGLVREAVAGVWSDYEGLDTLARAITTIERRYVRSVAPSQLAHAAVAGMTNALDSHSMYHSPEEWQSLSERNEGSGTGIGLALDVRGGSVVVSEVIPEGPADLAGIGVGMMLSEVDGKPIHTVEEADAVLVGEVGSTVVLTVVSDATDARQIRVVRDTFEDIRVGGAPLPYDLYYIRVGRFGRGAVHRFDQQLSRMGAATRGLVLDLRGNPGGLLSEAGAIADRFLDGGTIVHTVARDGVVDGRVEATPGGAALSLPVVILIDRHSASAAEVLAGALQERGRALLVGEQSYGKGSVQSIVEFEDGGALRLTTAAYRLPNDRFIDREQPLIPDVATPTETKSGPRTRLVELIRSSVADPERRDAFLNDLDQLEDQGPSAISVAPIPIGADPSDFLAEDAALQAAIALLRGGARGG